MIPMLPPTEQLDEIRVMTPEEVAAEESVFAAQGASLPDTRYATFIGVFRGGKRVAFLVLQIKLHAEPLLIEEGHSAVLGPLVSFAERYILEKCGPQWVYLFAPAGRTAQLAQAMGMQLEPYVILSKLVQAETPSKGVTELVVPRAETEVVQ